MIAKVVTQIAAILTVLMFSLLAHADGAGKAMLKVTIAVDGMMKSKSGAT